MPSLRGRGRDKINLDQGDKILSYKRSNNITFERARARLRAGRPPIERPTFVRRSNDVALSRFASRAASTTLANFHGPRRLFTRLRAIPTPLTPRALHCDLLPANAAPITLSVRAVKPGVATGTGMPALVVVASRPRPRLAREEDDADDDERRRRAVSHHPARVPSSRRRSIRRRRGRRRRRRRHRVFLYDVVVVDARPRRIDRRVINDIVVEPTIINDVTITVLPRRTEPARRRRHPRRSTSRASRASSSHRASSAPRTVDDPKSFDSSSCTGWAHVPR